MVRAFQTHKIRKSKEISSDLWNFCTLPQEGKSISKKVAVPSCWQNYPDTITYRGKAYYERNFEQSGNIRLEFKGISHTAEVYLDGEKIAEHYNAYTPFSVIAKNLKEGQHTIRVYVDNSFGPNSALHVPNDYQSYGGITRPVVLEELKDQFISRMHFTPIYQDGKWYGVVEAVVQNLGEETFEGNISIHIDKESIVTLPLQIDGNSEVCLQTEPFLYEKAKAWNMDTPVLYFLSVVLQDKNGLAIDDLIDRIGFREVRVKGKDILLNGEKIKIKGLCRHEDHPQFGCAIPYAAMYQDLLLYQDMGANSVRTVHYPNDELFLDLCDELGILVWEENHARGLSEEDMRNPNFEKQCEDCIVEMIKNHYNHPSIYIWGILNECASDTEYGKECYQKQYELIKQLDKSRPRSSASCRFKTDICFGYPEVVSYNIYPLWYHDTPPKDYLADLYDWVQEETEGADKPFLITEVGAGAIYGYRTPTKVKWSEEYQAETLEKQLTAILEHEGCSGVYIWQFCDCRVCDSWFDKRPRTMNNKGVVDEYRRPKLSYEVVKKIFTSEGGN